jgi:hypothetical protein
MKKASTIAGLVIILNSCIWGFAMIMSSRALSGTGAYEQIQNILGGGAGFSLILVGGGIAGLMMQLKSRGDNS